MIWPTGFGGATRSHRPQACAEASFSFTSSSRWLSSRMMRIESSGVCWTSSRKVALSMRSTLVSVCATISRCTRLVAQHAHLADELGGAEAGQGHRTCRSHPLDVDVPVEDDEDGIGGRPLLEQSFALRVDDALAGEGHELEPPRIQPRNIGICCRVRISSSSDTALQLPFFMLTAAYPRT